MWFDIGPKLCTILTLPIRLSTVMVINITSTTSHLKSLNTRKNHGICRWKSRSRLGTDTKCDGVEPINGVQARLSPHTRNWITTNDNKKYMNKQIIHKKSSTDLLPVKMTTHYHKNKPIYKYGVLLSIHLQLHIDCLACLYSI